MHRSGPGCDSLGAASIIAGAEASDSASEDEPGSQDWTLSMKRVTLPGGKVTAHLDYTGPNEAWWKILAEEKRRTLCNQNDSEGQKQDILRADGVRRGSASQPSKTMQPRTFCSGSSSSSRSSRSRSRSKLVSAFLPRAHIASYVVGGRAGAGGAL